MKTPLTRYARTTSLLVCVSLLGVSCADGTTASPPSDGAPLEMQLGAAHEALTVASELTDAQIAAVTTMANVGEVSHGLFAIGAARSLRVRGFAELMISNHTLAQRRQAALLFASHIAPAPNALSDALRAESEAMLTELESHTGSDFDAWYMDFQIAMHTHVLKLLTERLIPEAANPALRADLRVVKLEVQQHLTLARLVRASL